MLNEKYAVYYEVELYMEEDNENFKEGGFFYASSYEEAAAELEVAYRDCNLMSMSIEIWDSFELTFPVNKAREIRNFMREEQ